MELRNLLLRRQRGPSRNHHDNSGRHFTQLPLEILLNITEHLSPDDVASLLLCNRALLKALGTRPWSSLRPGKENEKYRESFLTTLTRDLPGHFLCHHCSCIHLRDNLGPPGPALQPKTRLLCIKSLSRPLENLDHCVHAHQIGSFFRFTFPHLQLAMKRHFHGAEHGIPYESLSFTEVHVSYPRDEAERLTTLLSVEARICSKPSSLCLRIQHWALISRTARRMLLSRTNFVMICDHLQTRSSDVSQLIQSRLELSRTDEEDQTHLEVRRCPSCNTHFQVEVKDLGGEGIALVITKWLDLGSGLTPTDPKWKAHLPAVTRVERLSPDEAGDVRLRFESEPGLSQDDLSRQNLSYLTSKRYMSTMDRWSHSTWILQAGRRLPFSKRSNSDALFFAFLVFLNGLYIMLGLWYCLPLIFKS